VQLQGLLLQQEDGVQRSEDGFGRQPARTTRMARKMVDGQRWGRGQQPHSSSGALRLQQGRQGSTSGQSRGGTGGCRTVCRIQARILRRPWLLPLPLREKLLQFAELCREGSDSGGTLQGPHQSGGRSQCSSNGGSCGLCPRACTPCHGCAEQKGGTHGNGNRTSAPRLSTARTEAGTGARSLHALDSAMRCIVCPPFLRLPPSCPLARSRSLARWDRDDRAQQSRAEQAKFKQRKGKENATTHPRTAATHGGESKKKHAV
jgi:hypothetical protein